MKYENRAQVRNNNILINKKAMQPDHDSIANIQKEK